MDDFNRFFAQATASPDQAPYAYQREMAAGNWPDVLIAPTGLGKTAAIILSWLWRRWKAPDETPLRLVYCLPMRTLVEQTAWEAEKWLRNLAGLGGDEWPQPEDGVTLLQGGMDRVKMPAWIMHPDRPAIIIGTQDMLLSRALMRGYGGSRFQWPVEFALLHSDAQWVFDEVQLMQAGLATSTQLQGFRRHFKAASARPTRSLWVSATLSPDWLETVDHPIDQLEVRRITNAPEAEAVKRMTAPKRVESAASSLTGTSKKEVADYIKGLAGEIVASRRPDGPTLVILNTVARAQEMYKALLATVGPDHLVLVHSRFRAEERRQLRERLRHLVPGDVVVATQAIEAGIDISSAVMFTELAPWPSLVQRFGRVNRYGEFGPDQPALIRWIDIADDVKGELARPYDAADLTWARGKLAGLTDAAPLHLMDIPCKIERPHHVIRRKDFLDLFDTDPDLTGFDTDISPWVRDATDTDVLVFWRDLAGEPTDEQPAPGADELCRVPIGRIRDLLRGRKAWHDDPQAERKKPTWVRLQGNPWPGLTLMLRAADGGYDQKIGLDPTTQEVVPILATEANEVPGLDGDQDTRQPKRAVPLTRHLRNVEMKARRIASGLKLDAADTEILAIAARWHDVGKAHEEFQARMDITEPGPWAKSTHFNRSKGRPYFRHELASALAYLQTHDGASIDRPAGTDLIAYLIAAHHGKVRLSLRALPKEEAADNGARYARGVWEGDELPAVDLGDGTLSPAVALRLELMEMGHGDMGPSWTERTRGLLRNLGPFRLAWLETLLRIADWQASADEQQPDDGEVGA